MLSSLSFSVNVLGVCRRFIKSDVRFYSSRLCSHSSNSKAVKMMFSVSECVSHAHTRTFCASNPSFPGCPPPHSEQPPASFQPRVLSATFNALFFFFLIASPRRNIGNNWLWQSWLIRNALIRTFFVCACSFPFENPHAAHGSRRLGDQPVPFSAQTLRAG